MSKLYMKRPMAISAQQWNKPGDHPAVVQAGTKRTDDSDAIYTVESNHGLAVVKPGDWIITTPQGETYPVTDAVFRDTYQPLGKMFDTDRMDFGAAIRLMQTGERVCRKGWNGKGMWLAITRGREVAAEGLWSHQNQREARAQGGTIVVRPYITMRTADGEIVPWVASQSDMLATDWAWADSSASEDRNEQRPKD